MEHLQSLEALGFKEYDESPPSARGLKDQSGGNGGSAGTGSATHTDLRSIYVGNVEYSATKAELADVFSTCGEIKRITIPAGPSGRPQGYAYVEFATQDAATSALGLAGVELHSRPLRVSAKKSNIGGYDLFSGKVSARGRGRGRGRLGFGSQSIGFPDAGFGYRRDQQ
eukprot:jgi/Chrzof1/2199/Cz11g06040.t1